MSIYLSTRAGNLPKGCTLAQVGLGHEPLKRSIPFYSDNRVGIITDLAGSDSLYRVFKTQLFIPRCKMAFSIGERGRNERDTFHTSTFIYYTHLFTANKPAGDDGPILPPFDSTKARTENFLSPENFFIGEKIFFPQNCSERLVNHLKSFGSIFWTLKFFTPGIKKISKSISSLNIDRIESNFLHNV